MADPDVGPALVLGSVRGRRSFGLAPDGRLTGLYYRQPWGPGENVASCHHDGGVVAELPGGGIAVQGAATRPIGTAHGLAGCTCGFYAYYRADPYARSQRVSGVIEGYGRVVLGTKGFRAERARILALLLPAGAAADEATVRASTDNPDDHAGPEWRRDVARLEGTPAPEEPRTLTWDQRARVRQRYPEAVCFNRLDAMLAAFPPTEDGPTL